MADLNKETTETKEVAESAAAEKAVAAKKGKEKKPASKKNKISLGQRIKKFFKDYKSELKKIVWLAPKTTFQYTAMVLCIMVIVSAFIGALDFVFSKLLMLVGGLI